MPTTVKDKSIGGGRHDHDPEHHFCDLRGCGDRRPGDGAGLHPAGRRRELRRWPARHLHGDAIVWADGTRSNLASQHPSVIIGNKSSVVVGQGVFVGKGKGVVPMENPSDPRQARCPVLDGVSYCY